MRRWFRRDVQVRHLGDLRRIFDRPTGRVFDVDRRAVPTVDALLGRGDREPDPEILAALENRVLIAPEFTRRETLQVTGAAAGLITSFVLPSASAAASTGLTFSSTNDNGAVTLSAVTIDQEDFDLYEVKYTLIELEDNATITRSLTFPIQTPFVSFLVVGGGGAGGDVNTGTGVAGGGGAGEVVELFSTTVEAGTYILSVGAGGQSSLDGVGGQGVGSSVRRDSSGTDFIFAKGGGGGGRPSSDATRGGSAGGQGENSATPILEGDPGTVPTGATSYANDGGTGASRGGGGGGGAASDGANGTTDSGGNGGSGYDAQAASLTDSALTLAIGGGGAGYSARGTGRSSAFSEGRGAFRDAGERSAVFAQQGLNGTGDGGGGGLKVSEGTANGRRGGTGVIYVRVPKAA